MRILLLGKRTPYDKVIDFETCLAHHIPHALEAAGVDVVCIDADELLTFDKADALGFFQSLDLTSVDHIIGLGLRYFDKLPYDCGESLRKRFKGAVCQLYDGGMLDGPPVDITFTFRNDNWRYPLNSPSSRYDRHNKYNKYIGWAADPNLFVPNQSAHELRILVDHSAYDASCWDVSLFVLLSLKKLVQSDLWQDEFTSLRIRRIVDGQIRDYDSDDLSVRPYTANTINYNDIVQEMNASHLFMVTHKESLGLCVIESAMAGCLPVIPSGFVPLDRTETVRCFTYESVIDWKPILGSINPRLTRDTALNNSWRALANNIVKHLINFNRNET
ncbi:hypothetical protein [Brucella pseudogrignonensis]|uniref:hypothetical protein n=1 Tax=Brucella pseudogrignonensis TaxID=419475 RepID=UPI003D965D29